MISPINNISNRQISFGTNAVVGAIYPNVMENLEQQYDVLKDSSNTIRKDVHNTGKAMQKAEEALKANPSDSKLKEAFNLAKENFVNAQQKLEDIIKQSKDLSQEIKEATKTFREQGKPEAEKVPGFIKTIFKGMSKLGDMKIMQSGKALAIAVATGNVLKEIVGTTMYTVQALNNTDIPKDKRKFVGMYDLMVGLVSTACSIIFGFGAISMFDGLYNKMLGDAAKVRGPKYPRYAAAFGALAFVVPTIFQTIIAKRIVAPALATPWASKMKNKKFAELEASKAQATAQNATTEKTDDKVTSKETKQEELPVNKQGFVDLKTYVNHLKEPEKEQETLKSVIA